MIGNDSGPSARIYDVVVVGAGPAGSITALTLAKGGGSVLLIEKSRFPRPKICGCCVNPRALDVLRQAGLSDLAGRLGAIPLRSLALGRGDKLAVIRQPLGVAVSRYAFDLALVESARTNGAEFHPETTASLLPASSPEYRDLRLTQGGESRTVRGRFVVAATGLIDSLRVDDAAQTRGRPGHEENSAISTRIGAGAIAPNLPGGYDRGRIYMACGDEGYVGLVALEDGRLDIAAALDPAAVRRSGGIGALAGKILAGSPFPEVPEIEQFAWKGTPSLTRSAATLARERVFRVGDAAGYVEPFTGEGIAWALSGGVRLAGILAESLATGACPPERLWPDAYRGEITRTQLVCRAARLVLRAPRLTGSLVRILAIYPGLAAPFIRSIHQTRWSPSGRLPGGLEIT
ncbi:MAG: FAD-dependent monooxygenase [Isosphaeraceae bacterium]